VPCSSSCFMLSSSWDDRWTPLHLAFSMEMGYNKCVCSRWSEIMILLTSQPSAIVNHQVKCPAGFSCFFFCFFFFETALPCSPQTHCIVQTGLKLRSLGLTLDPQCSGYRCVLPCCLQHNGFFFCFLIWWYWDLNSGTPTCLCRRSTA
jgi:hypothetical protein